MRTFKLFALGSNASGQLGIGHRDDTAQPGPCVFEQSDIELLPAGDTIVEVVAGGNHTLVRFGSGAVFASGSNEHGQCGLPQHEQQTSTFRRLVVRASGSEGEVKVFSNIAATWMASFLVENSQRIHVSGAGSKGELGLGEGVTQSESATFTNISEIVGRPSEIIDITGGMNHVVLLTSDGMTFGWGASRKGQLGEKAKVEKVCWKPMEISIRLKPDHVLAGRDFTLFSDSAGSCMLLGESRHLSGFTQLGSFDQLSCGWSNIYVLSRGRVTGSGRDDKGQLPRMEWPDLRMIAAGSEHCLGLTTAGNTIVWGWGEHGNCGEDVDDRGVVTGRWNSLCLPLEHGETVIRLAAGCATSFIVVERKA